MSSSFLLASQPAMGHLNPMLTIARELRERGHEPVFCCWGPPRIEAVVRDQGWPSFRVRSAPSSVLLALLPCLTGFWETAYAVRLFLSGLTFFARQLQPHLRRLAPAAVVVDFGFPGARLAAEVAGVPPAVVYSAGLLFDGPGIPPPGSGLPIGEDWGARGRRLQRIWGAVEASVDRSFARARRRLGLPPVSRGRVSWLTSPWLTLMLTAEAIEMPRHALPASTFFVGPCFAGRRDTASAGFAFDRLAEDRPKVFVSLGTVFNRRPGAYQRIIDGLAGTGCQLVVAAGGAHGALAARPQPADVLLFERVPQLELLPRVDAVVSHGGNNTVNETLAAGKPLLVMPVGGEQGDNAARIVHLGLGLRADLRASTPAQIGAKVSRLLREPEFGERARRAARALAETDGPVSAASLIEHLGRTRRPLLRPEGYPLTRARGLPEPWEWPAASVSV